jgi:2-polyprenyl-3-methyl-5-hydroxy-6-metoxy-1,4-benzoquinol methylase
MLTLEEKLAKSLSAESVKLIPYLPYLLQDLWELGSSPRDMVNLISRNIKISENTKVLDLACGKGAVSINIAKKFGCKVKGIDIIPVFIEYAKEKAKEYRVEALCEFVVGDINRSVKAEKDYDIVILGAVGAVLGQPAETLDKLTETIHDNGYVLLDDGYAKSESNEKHITNFTCLSKKEWIGIIEKSGYRMIEDLLVDESELSGVLDDQIRCLTQRCNELKEKYPDQANLFDQYMKSQLTECEELENDIMGVTMLLQRHNFTI